MYHQVTAATFGPTTAACCPQLVAPAHTIGYCKQGTPGTAYKSRSKPQGRCPYLECSRWGSSCSSTCPCLGLKLLNHLKNFALESRDPVLLMVLLMSLIMPLPGALPALPIAAGRLLFAAALGLPIGKASPDDLMAAMEAAGIVAPGLKAVIVWPILLAEVCVMPAACYSLQ